MALDLKAHNRERAILAKSSLRGGIETEGDF